MAHIPVLLHEVIGGVRAVPGMVVLDATVGGGGYTKALGNAVGKSGTVIGLDRDGRTLAMVREKLDVPCTLFLEQEDFRNLDLVLERLGIPNIDGATFDLGLSSLQLEESGRGFSFLRDEPLQMTFADVSETAAFTAADVVNTWKEEDIANVLFGYGEERYARRIAKEIVTTREKTPIEMTSVLVDCVKRAVPGRYRNGKIHPATKTFQALRIAVNDELNALSEGLQKAYTALATGGRMAVVSFHSLEDRIVKQYFRARAEDENATIITKKPIVPTREEERVNPRARSAKLRILEKTS